VQILENSPARPRMRLGPLRQDYQCPANRLNCGLPRRLVVGRRTHGKKMSEALPVRWALGCPLEARKKPKSRISGEVCFAGTKCAALPTSDGQRCFPDAVRCLDVSRMAIRFLMLAISCSAPLLAQKPAAPAASDVQEFPVIMRQNVTAGKTPVGTEVQAKLMVGTIGDGTVSPTNAIFSGRVIDYVANTSTEPSRLAIGMDSVQ